MVGLVAFVGGLRQWRLAPPASAAIPRPVSSASPHVLGLEQRLLHHAFASPTVELLGRVAGRRDHRDRPFREQLLDRPLRDISFVVGVRRRWTKGVWALACEIFQPRAGLRSPS